MAAAIRESLSKLEPARRLTQSDVVPRAVIDPQALSYRVLRPRTAGIADVAVLGEAYQCWAEVWKETFAELDDRHDLPSDDFTRQDAIGALFHGYECIALSFFRWVDLASPITRADSYFSVWPEEVCDAACARGSRICVSSNFTIRAPWRRAQGCSVKDVLGGLGVEHFLVSEGDALVGTMRADRGMSRLTDRLGFERLRGNVIHHGVEVDLVCFYRDSCVRKASSAIDEEIIRAAGKRTY